jgi:thiosulfate/3-mercaptopyruvate sulfurtransferase
MNVGAVALLDDMRMAQTDDSIQIVDARSPERFAGTAPEPRPGLRPGHMPRSFNVPFGRLIENGHLAPRARIEAAFTEAGVDLDKPIITSCGSGVTAAILTFALESIGKEPKGLYDGSWAEWASRPDLPVERG